jgi:hypothetical protein
LSEGAKKLDTGKLPVMRGVFLRFPRAMYEIARVSQVGTTKYAVPIDDMNYKNVPDGEGRYTDAVGRHLLDEAIHGRMNVEKGGALPEDGMKLLHAAQTAWDSLARLEIMLENYAKSGINPYDMPPTAGYAEDPDTGRLVNKVSRDTVTLGSADEAALRSRGPGAVTLSDGQAASTGSTEDEPTNPVRRAATAHVRASGIFSEPQRAEGGA